MLWKSQQKSMRLLEAPFDIALSHFVRPALCSALLLCVSLCSGRELLTLRSGFSIEAKSHEIQNDVVVIATFDGTIEVPLTEVTSFETFSEAAVVAPPSDPGKSDTEAAIISAATSQGLLPELVRSVAKIESGLQQKAVSPKGAVGLMQLMPGTAAELGVQAQNAEANALGGAKYLRALLLHYKGDAALALAAYNAGPAAVSRYSGIPPFAETRQYVVRVLNELAREQSGHLAKP